MGACHGYKKVLPILTYESIDQAIANINGGAHPLALYIFTSDHGKDGFQTFSHVKSIVDKKTWIDLPMRYQPYTDLYDRLVRMFVR